MSGLDSRYVLAPSLQEYFVDKDSGLPLANGLVYFFIDGTNIPKDVFEISGTPPNFTYTVLPNPCILSAVGTFVDASGNDILPYYFPFDETGAIQLYTIKVYNSDGVLQFTREGYPNYTKANVEADQDIINFVPNGQFLLHNNIPAWSGNLYVADKVSEPVTYIAPGGWSFERNVGSTASDFITFPRYGSAITSPTGNPRYAVEINTTIAGSDTRKDLCLMFPDVNTFASDTQSYNFYFEAQSVTASDIDNVQIIVRKFFGTGGSPSATTETNIESITLKGEIIQKYNIPILFGTNAGATIGTNNDDYVQICIRLPATGTQTALFTDFLLTVNDAVVTSFPPQTDADQIDQSTIGFLASDDPDGFDLYLPLVLTLAGTVADHSQVGKIYASISATAVNNELLCDGSQYLTSDYSTLGIPYARLQQVLLAEGQTLSVNVPLYGTGANFATANLYTTPALNNLVRITTNKAGSSTGTAEGSPATTFTFGSIHTGLTTGVIAYSNTTAGIVVFGLAVGAVTAAADVNSGCTIAQAVNNAFSYHVFEILTPASSAITTGHYFNYSTTTTNYYVWFNINGGGGDPAPPGRTGIQIAIPNTYNAQDVANVVREALNGSQLSTVQTVAGASIPASSNFTFVANTITYYVWFEIAGAGSAPLASNASTAIPVILLGTETNVQVAQAIQLAINNHYFAVPDFRGLFLRGVRGTGMWDVNASVRWSDISGVFGNSVGTFELDTFQSHTHTAAFNSTIGLTNSNVGAGGTPTYRADNPGLTVTIGSIGNAETQPLNAAVNWFIKY